MLSPVMPLGELRSYSSLFYAIASVGDPIWDRTIKTAKVSYIQGSNRHVWHFNPDFYNRLNDTEKAFVIAHEACHILLDHPSRLSSLYEGYSAYLDSLAKPDKKAESTFHWQACDSIVNRKLIVEYGFNPDNMPILGGNMILPETMEQDVSDMLETLPEQMVKSLNLKSSDLQFTDKTLEQITSVMRRVYRAVRANEAIDAARKDKERRIQDEKSYNEKTVNDQDDQDDQDDQGQWDDQEDQDDQGQWDDRDDRDDQESWDGQEDQDDQGSEDQNDQEDQGDGGGSGGYRDRNAESGEGEENGSPQGQQGQEPNFDDDDDSDHTKDDNDGDTTSTNDPDDPDDYDPSQYDDDHDDDDQSQYDDDDLDDDPADPEYEDMDDHPDIDSLDDSATSDELMQSVIENIDRGSMSEAEAREAAKEFSNLSSDTESSSNSGHGRGVDKNGVDFASELIKAVVKPKVKPKWETVVKKWLEKELDDGEEGDSWLGNKRSMQWIHLANDETIARRRKGEHVTKDQALLAGLLLPGTQPLISVKPIAIHLYLDTSGSCMEYAARFIKAARTFPPNRFKLSVFGFTTKVYPIDIRQPNPSVYYGGTSFSIIEEHIMKTCQDKYPKAVFVITDGDGDFVRPLHPDRWYWFIVENEIVSKVYQSSSGRSIGKPTTVKYEYTSMVEFRSYVKAMGHKAKIYDLSAFE